MAAQYRQLPPDVQKKRAGIIKEAESIKGRMTAAKTAGEDTSAHEAALTGLSDRHERLLSPYKISTPDAQETIASGGTPAKGATHKVNLDTAREDADSVEASHRASGGKAVRALNVEDIKAADADKSWASKTPEEQQATAKAKPVEGAAHTTSTPGAAPQTAMAAALSKAGVSAPAPATLKPSSTDTKTGQPTYQSKDKALTVTPGVADRNNMAIPRGGNDTSVVSGVTTHDSQGERDRARAAATRGSRGAGSKAAEAAAAQASTRRSAASRMPVKGPQFDRVGGTGAEESSAAGRDWITPSQIKGGIQPATPAPAKNPAPHAPVPTANATPAAPSTPTATPGQLGHVIGSKPERGVSPGHMVSSAPGRDWLTPQAANKAKAAKAPKAVVSEEPALAPSPAPKQANTVGGVGRKAPSSAAAVGNVNREPMAAGNDYSSADRAIGGVRHNIGGPLAQNTPMAGPQVERAHAGEISGATTHVPSSGTRTPVASPGGSGHGGRTGSAPRSGEVGGGRVSGGSAGGLHIANEGNENTFSNIGNVTHHTTVNNYGTMSGNSIGNAGGYGRAPGGSGVGGGHREPHEGGGQKPASGHGFNAWYKDSTGHHDLRKGLDHVTGRTGGSGERLDTSGSKPSNGTIGGSQRPIKGSPRAAGGSAPAQPQPTTGTTHNWQGPQAGKVQSASGNGTAQTNPAP